VSLEGLSVAEGFLLNRCLGGQQRDLCLEKAAASAVLDVNRVLEIVPKTSLAGTFEAQSSRRIGKKLK
jgi:hypothetical protein